MSSPAPYPPVDGTQPCVAEPEAFFPDRKVEADASQVAGPGSAQWRHVAPSTREGYWSIQYAVDLCAACPFRRPCLAYALTVDVIGVWGGTTHLERKRLRKQHGITAHSVTYTDTEALHGEIERLTANGLGASDIGRRLGVSPQTVWDHRRRHGATEGASA